MNSHAKSALTKGLITEADIDERLALLFKVRMRLGHFDPAGPLSKIPTSVICSDYAKAIARDGVAQSVVLLKNTGGRLPLDAKALKSIAVIGPNANLSQDVSQYYGPGSACDNEYPNMVDAIHHFVAATTTAKGVPAVDSSDVSGVAAAADLAAAADAVVLVLGTDLSMGAEGHDFSDIRLPEGQVKLAQAVLAAAKSPVVIVMLTAAPLDISMLLDHPKVGAVLHAGQVGVQTLGVADVLFGTSPAGRLVQTIYPASYADEVSIFDFNMRPGASAWPRPDCKTAPCPMGTNPGRTHRFYTGQPVKPFGYGLSYTTFQYEVASAPSSVSLSPALDLVGKHRHGFISSSAVTAAGPAVQYEVKVTNTGSVDADDVVLGFLTPPGAGENGVPLVKLFGFQRVHVPAGQSRTVNLYPTWSEFTHVDQAGIPNVLPGRYKVSFGIKDTQPHGMGFAELDLLASDAEIVV